MRVAGMGGFVLWMDFVKFVSLKIFETCTNDLGKSDFSENWPLRSVESSASSDHSRQEPARIGKQREC